MYRTPTNGNSTTALHNLLLEISLFGAEQQAQIFSMMDRLDAEARERGEPQGLRVRYALDVTPEGITVFRGADLPKADDLELPAGCAEVYLLSRGESGGGVELLGPVMIERPEKAETAEQAIVRPDAGLAGGLKETNVLKLLAWERKLNRPFAELFPAERSLSVSSPRVGDADYATTGSTALAPVSAASLPFLTSQMSGLSPPKLSGECGHSGRKMSPGRKPIDLRRPRPRADL